MMIIGIGIMISIFFHDDDYDEYDDDEKKSH